MTEKEPLQGRRRHKLLPLEVRDRLPRLGAQDGESDNAIAHVKFFCPYGRATWYLTEFDPPEEGDLTGGIFFGYCVSPLGPDCDEWGYVSFDELATTTVFGGVPAVERDCHWDPKPVRECEGVIVPGGGAAVTELEILHDDDRFYLFEDVAELLWPDDFDRDNHTAEERVRGAMVHRGCHKRGREYITPNGPVGFDSESGTFECHAATREPVEYVVMVIREIMDDFRKAREVLR